MKILIALIKYASFSVLFLAVALLSSMAIGAQTKRAANSKKAFSVPCAKALRIGLSAVEKIHSREMERLTKGNSDSDTELLENQNAAKNYLACRRADTAAKLKNLIADKRKQINLKSETARRIARMRVDLIAYVSFDDKFEDPVNYVITQNAIALVEDFKGNLTRIYGEKRGSNTLGNTDAAVRNERQINLLLRRIEKIALEHDEAVEFSAFKTAVEKNLAEIKDDIGTEKLVTTTFLVRLLQMNLANEN